MTTLSNGCQSAITEDHFGCPSENRSITLQCGEHLKHLFTSTLDWITKVHTLQYDNKAVKPTWFVVILIKHPEAKFGRQKDKQKCQTRKLLSKVSRVPTNFFPGNVKDN